MHGWRTGLLLLQVGRVLSALVQLQWAPRVEQGTSIAKRHLGGLESQLRALLEVALAVGSIILQLGRLMLEALALDMQ